MFLWKREDFIDVTAIPTKTISAMAGFMAEKRSQPFDTNEIHAF